MPVWTKNNQKCEYGLSVTQRLHIYIGKAEIDPGKRRGLAMPQFRVMTFDLSPHNHGLHLAVV